MMMMNLMMMMMMMVDAFGSVRWSVTTVRILLVSVNELGAFRTE